MTSNLPNPHQLEKKLTNLFGTELLATSRSMDRYANGAQYLSDQPITTIGLAVTLSESVLNQAINSNCQALIVHHGLSLTFPSNQLDPLTASYIHHLVSNRISLFGYHHALDAHPEFGHAASILNALDLKPDKPYFESWGRLATFPRPISINTLLELLEPVLGTPLNHFNFGPNLVSTIGVSTGASKLSYSIINQTITSNIDVHLTGEANETSEIISRQLKIHYLSFGHYRTETFGIKALQQQLSSIYPGCKLLFLDSPTIL